MDGSDAVGLAVDRSAPVALVPSEVPGVVTSLDEVADSGEGAVAAEGHPVLLDAAEPDQFGAPLRGQASGLLVGVDQQERPAPGEGVAAPGNAEATISRQSGDGGRDRD